MGEIEIMRDVYRIPHYEPRYGGSSYWDRLRDQAIARDKKIKDQRPRVPDYIRGHSFGQGKKKHKRASQSGRGYIDGNGGIRASGTPSMNQGWVYDTILSRNPRDSRGQYKNTGIGGEVAYHNPTGSTADHRTIPVYNGTGRKRGGRSKTIGHLNLVAKSFFNDPASGQTYWNERGFT